ncbi:hypothetical protein C2845_PM07G03280 [Panicum miliaceum]|uniref:Uncharacterized protein n=1 Tax=Panicum miliaceum TaxID=4540 RepID=A0A3L6SR97_PANMI|nr:hypothetical protein C2845_PM07G03280 [Panicum miliaceum]
MHAENDVGRHHLVAAERRLLSVLAWPLGANRTLTFADWDRRRRTGFHPHAHRAEEVTAGLIGEIRSGERAGANCSAYGDAARGVCYLFARKFMLGFG